MPANSPADICRLFQQAMAASDLEAVLTLYDSEAVFVMQTGEVTKGRDALREQLAPRVASKTRFDYDLKQVVETGNIALMHTHWTVYAEPQPGLMKMGGRKEEMSV